LNSGLNGLNFPAGRIQTIDGVNIPHEVNTTHGEASFFEEKSKLYKKNESTKLRPLLVIPSEEGLISQLMRIAGFLEIALLHNRSLILAPFISHHYPDFMEKNNSFKRINMCEIFKLSEKYVRCLSQASDYHENLALDDYSFDQLVLEASCSILNFNAWMETHPGHFGLESFDGVNFSHSFNWKSSDCVILGIQVHLVVLNLINSLILLF
jgi:hypothetical protein